jgi:putative sigma-54 modulation protein
MQLTIKGKNMDVTETLKSYAEKRINRITRYFDNIISTDVTLSIERGWHIIEVNVFADGFVLRGEERTNDMYTSIDKVIEKLEVQIKKQKEKFIKKARTPHNDIMDFGGFEPKHVQSGEEKDLEVGDLTVKTKKVNISSLSIEEAIKEIEAMGLAFLVFQNPRTKHINVIFKRKEGYGLIDPVMS